MHGIGHDGRTVSEPTTNKFDDSEYNIKKKRPPNAFRSIIATTLMAMVVTVHV
jgi:hypothetical protein